MRYATSGASPVKKGGAEAKGGDRALDPAMGSGRPPEALDSRRSSERSREGAHLPSPYREETANFTVSVGEGTYTWEVLPLGNLPHGLSASMGDRENSMQPVDGLTELRGQGRMTWIDQEHGWVAAPEDIMKVLSSEPDDA
jgi:hypothetical protein